MLSVLVLLLLGTALVGDQTSPVAQNQHDSQSPVVQSIEARSLPKDSKSLVPIKIEKATYPDAARDKGVQGQVLVKIHVNEAGDVEGVEVVSGDPLLAESALAAARKWKFQPFIRDGKAVPATAVVPFDFAFRENITNPKTTVKRGGRSQLERTPGASSQGVKEGRLIYTVAPVYPPEAKQQGVTGDVVLTVTIGKDGRMKELKPVSGPKILFDAAVGAVQQWRYEPYELNGEPVEVKTTITVHFKR